MVTRKRMPARRLNNAVRKVSLIGSYVALACAAAPAAMAQEVAQATDSKDTVSLPTVKVEAQRAAPDASPYADPAAPYKADSLSSSKFTEPVLNTARSLTVLTKEALDDKNATTLREIGRSTAGVTLGTGEGGNAFGDRFFIRGFDARNDIFVDGVRDPGVSVRENFNTEQVEILRGPASTFAGRGTTGGAINIVTKQAGDVDFYRTEATYGFQNHEKRVTVDLNKAISPTLDLRVNGLLQGGDVAGRDYATDYRNGVAAAMTWKPRSDFTVKAAYSHTDLYGLPDFGVPYNKLLGAPVTDGGVARNTYYGAVNRDFTEAVQNMGTLDASWKTTEWLTLENKFRQGHSLLNYIGTIPENPSAAGVTAPFSQSATFFSGFTQLNAQSRYQKTDVIADEPQAIIKFDTGKIKHTAVAGADFSSERISIDTYTGFTSELTTGPAAFTSAGAPIVSVYSPTNFIFGAGVAKLTGNPLRYSVNTNSAYVLDTANYNDRIIVNGGVRYDSYRITTANNTTSNSAYSGIPSYNVGLVYKPSQISSVYAAYATAANPIGSELDATSSTYGGFAPAQTTTQIYGPQKSRASELGTKWELFDRHLLATASIFQTDVDNARETAPAGIPGVAAASIIAGAAYRIRGLDFEVAGKVTDKWSVMGGLVLMKSEVTQSIVPTNVGLRLANIAHQSFNLLTKYKVTPKLELGGQSVYTSKIYGGSLLAANGGTAYPNPIIPTMLPPHWRFDIFAEAKVSAHASLKLYVENLFNKTYYDSLYQSAVPFVAVAPGRNASLVATVKF